MNHFIRLDGAIFSFSEEKIPGYQLEAVATEHEIAIKVDEPDGETCTVRMPKDEALVFAKWILDQGAS